LQACNLHRIAQVCDGLNLDSHVTLFLDDLRRSLHDLWLDAFEIFNVREWKTSQRNETSDGRELDIAFVGSHYVTVCRAFKNGSTSTINFERVTAISPLIGGPIQVRQPPAIIRIRRAWGIISHRHPFLATTPSSSLAIFTMSDKINYADYFGFQSVAGAAVFAAAYVPLFSWFLRQSFQRPTYVFIVLTFFCTSKLCLVLILFGSH
jgi:hypothetical protein